MREEGGRGRREREREEVEIALCSFRVPLWYMVHVEGETPCCRRCDSYLLHFEGFWLQCRHMDFLKSFFTLAKRATG